MESVKSSNFPQMAEESYSYRSSSGNATGPSLFKQGNNVVFVRPQKLESAVIEGNGVTITCNTRGYLNRVVNTHETRMHQFIECEKIFGKFQIRIEFWSESVFRVRYGFGKPDDWEDLPDLPQTSQMLVGVPDSNVSICLEESEAAFSIRTNTIKVEIRKDHFQLLAYDSAGKVFWEQCRTDLFTSDIFDISVSEHEGNQACFESFAMSNQEEIFGLGERFDHLARRGKTVDFWNKDAIGTSNARTYINVPFLLSTRGYGLFLHSSARTEWEIGTMEASTLGFSVEDKVMDYFIIYGPQPADILYQYSCLTGFSPTPPIWSFGVWMSRNSYLSWDVVHEVADELRKRDIPSDVLHLDTSWFQEICNCDLKFSTDRFANPEDNMKALKEKGFRISLWQWNYIPPLQSNICYLEALERGYLVLGEDGKPYSFPEGTIGSWIDDAIIDFSNPEAREWYKEKIKDVIAKGAATIKTDFGEGIPEDGVYKTVDGKKFHNLYPLVYNDVIAEAIYEVSGERIVWARSGTAGSQRFPIHWGGDSQCSWSGLSGTLRGALSLGLSGFPYFSHDIGGFIGRPNPELYVRWAQYGLFSSHSRCHGCGDDNSREPWSFGEQAENIFRDYAQLRYRLMPYIYSEALKSSATAKPMARALFLEYPQDKNVWRIDDEYLFGDSLLIAPVLEPMERTQSRSVYLPEGVWMDYWTKETIESAGKWIERPVDLQTMPTYVKAGSIIPYGEEKSSTHNEIGSIKRLELYGVEDGFYSYTDGVTSFTLTIEKSEITIKGLEYMPEIILFH